MYAMNLKLIPLIVCLGILLFFVLACFLSSRAQKRLFSVLCGMAVLLILRYTIIGRSFSDNHRFIFVTSYSKEFWREMIMNGLLYFPLGLAMPYAIRCYSMVIVRKCVGSQPPVKQPAIPTFSHHGRCRNAWWVPP